MTDSNKNDDVKKAISKRTAYLIDHPEMLLVQEKIDEALEKAGNDPVRRGVVIQTLLIEESQKLTQLNQELRNDVRSLIKLTRKVHSDLEEVNADLCTLNRDQK